MSVYLVLIMQTYNSHNNKNKKFKIMLVITANKIPWFIQIT